MTLILIFMAFLALGGGIYLFAIEHERNTLINAKISNQEVIRLAHEHDGKLSVGLLAQKTALDFTEAERKLYIMLGEGVFHHEYDEQYQPVFVLNPSPVQAALPAETHSAHGVPTFMPDGEIIRIAVEHKGKITVPLLCMKGKMQIDAAKALLERLQRKGIFEVEVNAQGSIVYILPDWEEMQG